MTSGRRIDLNADLGEGFGVWRLGDDDALLDIVTSANVACGFHAGDPSIMRRVCARAAAGGRRRRRPGVLPRPGRVRPPLPRRRAGGAGRRRALPARRAGRDRAGRRRPGVLRQAARGAVQRRGHPRGARPGGRRRRPGLRPPAAGAGPARLGAAAGGGGGRDAPGREGFADRGYTAGRHAGAAHASPAPWCTTPRWWPRGRCGWRPTASSRRWTARRCSCPSSRSACTATPRAPWRWPGRCARRWRPPG